MSKPVVLTGLRANNDLHIGNYLGALLPIIDFARTKADDYQINLFVPDLHSFTTPIDHSLLHDQILRTVRTYLALGLPVEHQNVAVYRQSRLPAHSELTWILSCFTSVGEMQRMTQFKEKSQQLGNDRTSVGLFSYPVLMAADILMYSASYVPVGDDQSQHLEFTRDIAERINKKFNSDVFVVPKPVKDQHAFFGKDQGLRIRNLVDPTKKMSKSDDSERGVIFLSDSPDSARKKIMSATTDSMSEVAYDYSDRPGVSNLLDILNLFGGDSAEYIGQSQYGPLKTAVADAVCAFLESYQQAYEALENEEIEKILHSKEEALLTTTTAIIESVQRVIGIRN